MPSGRTRRTPSRASCSSASPPISSSPSSTSRMHGRTRAVLSSHHDRRNGDGSGAASTSLSHAPASSPSDSRTSVDGMSQGNQNVRSTRRIPVPGMRAQSNGYHADRMDRWQDWPYGRIYLLLVAVAFVVVGIQVFLFHWRAAFRSKTMYGPVVLAPVVALAGIAAAAKRDGAI